MLWVGGGDTGPGSRLWCLFVLAGRVDPAAEIGKYEVFVEFTPVRSIDFCRKLSACQLGVRVGRRSISEAVGAAEIITMMDDAGLSRITNPS